MCEETERKLDNMLAMSKQMRIPINEPANDQKFQDKVQEVTRQMQTAQNLIFDKIEQDTANADKWVTEQNKNITDV